LRLPRNSAPRAFWVAATRLLSKLKARSRPR